MPLKTSTFYDLLEALKQPGCAACRLSDRYVRENIDSFFYENITNVARREDIRRSRGFCSQHASMLPAPARMLGTAILHHDVLNDVLREMKRSRGLKRVLGKRPLADAVAPKRECILCEFERDREQFVLSTLVNLIDEPELRAAFVPSDGICLPHLQSALRMAHINAAALAKFVGMQSIKMAKLRDELHEYIARSNGSYGCEGMGDEADSPLRAVRMVSGRIVRHDGR